MKNAMDLIIAFIRRVTAEKSERQAGLRNKGFTVVEVLIALFIAGVVSAAIYSIYNSYYRQSHIQDIVLEAQQNARVALNSMERELMNAGYAAGTPNILTEATANSIEFIYTDPETNPAMSATAQNRLSVRYALQTVAGVQYLIRRANNLTTSTVGNAENVIPYVQSLSFLYYDINGVQITDTSTQANRNNIKFITVVLVTQTREVIQGTLNPKTFMLETHIRLRNIGIGQTALDTTPPAAPTGVKVRDPGICGRLKVKWTLNTEGDIAGYKIYYGTSTGAYTGVINIPLSVLSASTYSCTKTGTTMECSIFPSDPPLAYTPSTAAPGTGTMYYTALKAYDNSLNHSVFSSEVSGNPATSNSDFNVAGDDSTINPAKPQPVTGLLGANGPADGQVALSWSSYNTSANPDVVGFRIYRSASPFTSYPVDPTMPGIGWIAGEPGAGLPQLTQSSTSYTDLGPGLLGCKVYYYAVAPVNCDPTLIADNGGDPVSKKYVQTDYSATCGDGVSACSSGTGFAAVTGSDTAPTKTSPPAAPTLGARAGWKRVAVSLTQPGDADLGQTCVYANQDATPPATYPALLTNTVTYPKASGCYQVDTGTTPVAIRLFENNGIFTVAQLPQNQSTSFWHNSMTTLTSLPSLLDTGIYSYRAVSFDLCGNASLISAAQATTTLCGEDPVGKPPAVTSANVSCCASPASLTWTGVSSNITQPSSVSNPWDLAGYRILRSTDSVVWSASTVLNPAAPFWGTTYDDTTATEGGTYYYRIVSTDCPYEKVNPAPATIISDMSGVLSSSWAQIGPVYPGRIDRDEECADTTAPATVQCTKDNHRAVLTGVNMDNSTGNGTGSSAPDTSFTHSKVTLFLNNTSAGPMTIQSLSVSWVNSSAILREIRIGGGRSGLNTQITNVAPGATTAVTGNPPYTSAASNIAIFNGTIPALSRYVPITFEFRDSSGKSVDMRNDQILMTLAVRNDFTGSSGTTGCVSYLTVSKASEGVMIPVGPKLTSVQQNQPVSPTFAYEVPGSTGLNTVPTTGSYGPIAVSGGLDVTVSVNVVPNTTDETTGGKIGVSAGNVKLYWAETALIVGIPPSLGFTAVTMTNSGGNIWSGVIPARNTLVGAKRVWYYIVAADNDGNFDRAPEMFENPVGTFTGAFTYDQKPFDPCDYTPSAPSSLTNYFVTNTSASVRWPRVTTYTTGSTINTSADPIVYQIWRRTTLAGSFTKIADVNDSLSTACVWNSRTAASPATGAYDSHCSGVPEYFYWRDDFTSPSDLTAYDVSYYVVAKNSCSASANTSTPSNQWRECQGAPSVAAISLTPATSIDARQSYTVTVNDCNLYGGAISTITVNSNSTLAGGVYGSYNVSLTESALNDGSFTGTVATKYPADAGAAVIVNPSDTVSDTVSVTCPACSGPPAAKTITVKTAACDYTPAAPTNLVGNKSGANVNLSWNANSEQDIAQYKIYRRVSTMGTTDGTWTFLASVPVGTTSYTDKPPNNNPNKDHHYYVTASDSCSPTAKESGASNIVGPYAY